MLLLGLLLSVGHLLVCCCLLLRGARGARAVLALRLRGGPALALALLLLSRHLAANPGAGGWSTGQHGSGGAGQGRGARATKLGSRDHRPLHCDAGRAHRVLARQRCTALCRRQRGQLLRGHAPGQPGSGGPPPQHPPQQPA
jgi:hypothetical protein